MSLLTRHLIFFLLLVLLFLSGCSSNCGYDDDDDKVHISYYDSSNQNVKYATNASGTWVTQTIYANEDATGQTTLAIDRDDKVHIGFRETDYYPYTVYYSTNMTGTWETSYIQAFYPNSLSMKLDTQGIFHMSVVADYALHHLTFPKGYSAAEETFAEWVKISR